MKLQQTWASCLWMLILSLDLYQISHYSDHSNNGIRSAVKIADKLIKAHCLPLDSVLKHSAP